ncbi:MAG: FHA domain-containing protein [Deltaproteobacteria bacterium]|nr:FHA domain-containing protein [Deltaproteobacteria bacterium]
MIRVLVLKDGEQLQTQEFNKSEIIFGRDREADVQLFAGAVSRRHARLARVQGRWQIADLGAANGVYVSKGDSEPERIVIHFLEPGDRIHIETFVVSIDDAGGSSFPDADSFDTLQEEFSLETKRTQFISMHDVLNGPGGEHLKAMGVQPGLTSSKEATSTTDDQELPAAEGKSVEQEGSWYAEMVSSDGHSRAFPLKKNEASVGTASSCDIVLPAGPAKVVQLSREGSTVSLLRTGRWPFPRVTVDGVVVKEALLNHGDGFFVGKFEVTLFLKQPSQ